MKGLYLHDYINYYGADVMLEHCIFLRYIVFLENKPTLPLKFFKCFLTCDTECIHLH